MKQNREPKQTIFTPLEEEMVRHGATTVGFVTTLLAASVADSIPAAILSTLGVAISINNYRLTCKDISKQ